MRSPSRRQDGWEGRKVTGAPATATPWDRIPPCASGFSPSAYLDPDGQGLKVPNLRRLKAEGSYARAVTGVLPTNTYPSHTTIVTGVPPRVHGILGNQIFDPSGTSNEAWYWYADEIQVPTLWTQGGTALLRLAEPNDLATLRKVRALFAAQAAEKNSGIAAVLDGEEIGSLGGDPAMSPVGLDAESGYRFDRDVVGEWAGASKDRAGHGYSPSRAALAASLLLGGPVARESADLGEISITDIAERILAYLN